ncbi:hypothetical protein PISL3812_08178 [Talaromyces islandicus]|uniref:R3H domain-containing protein n=1 Tax=Talaromyces islandicus TaxID=28573 RepID=A0A0U1M837_TALIS|nr:hypothetical protein PISL3812_08178 [Talaromyces islandicus]
MVMITCPCGRLRKEKRCSVNKAASNKGQDQRSESPPLVAQLKCDDECARLERNRTLASALKVDIDPSTTLNQHSTAATGTLAVLPYSEETLDIYVQLSSTSPLSTLQDYEATLHGLATSNAQRSVRFQPSKAPLRAFIHALASDWGFASESFDPEPHRHVFVLKPTQWNSPGIGLGSGIGIRGMTVGECVRLRDRELYKEREARRLAAAEAKALREASKAASAATDADGGGGWAQVASRRKPDGISSGTSTPLLNVTRTSTPTLAQMKANGGSMYAALSMDISASQKKKKDGLLVLRSGVGASKAKKGPAPEDLADTWEEQVEKEEQEERQSTSSQEMDRASPPPATDTV